MTGGKGKVKERLEDEVESMVKNANRSEVARRTGIHLSHVSRVFSGKRSASSNNLKVLSMFFGVTMDDLHQCITTIRQRYLNKKAREARVYGKSA